LDLTYHFRLPPLLVLNLARQYSPDSDWLTALLVPKLSMSSLYHQM
jgi:hypothetical protein